eukprot:scaffold5956_cov385-Prasinococcus_capsulatus_cf.AAC.8
MLATGPKGPLDPPFWPIGARSDPPRQPLETLQVAPPRHPERQPPGRGAAANGRIGARADSRPPRPTRRQHGSRRESPRPHHSSVRVLRAPRARKDSPDERRLATSCEWPSTTLIMGIFHLCSDSCLLSRPGAHCAAHGLRPRRIWP